MLYSGGRERKLVAVAHNPRANALENGVVHNIVIAIFLVGCAVIDAVHLRSKLHSQPRARQEAGAHQQWRLTPAVNANAAGYISGRAAHAPDTRA